MNKKLLLGSLFVLILILLMPSTPAIQMKSNEDSVNNKLINQVNIKDFEELLELTDVNHPLLLLFVISVVSLWWLRMKINFDLATEPSVFAPGFTITNMVFFIRCVFFMGRIELWLMNWEKISDYYGWEWFD